MELMIPVLGGEIWAEDTGGRGTPVVLVNPGWSTAGIWTSRAPARLAEIVTEQAV